MQEITLRGMRFHALVGIVPHERTVPQPIEIDLLVRLPDAGNGAILDYRELYEITAQTFRNGPVDYLEEIGDGIARRALALDGRIRSVRVAVRKPHVALAGPLAYAEVVTERQADD